MNFNEIIALDKADKLAHKRDEFDLPADTIYLDGNSLGALPKAVKSRVAEVVSQQWGSHLIRSWNDHQWIDLPTQVGEKIAPIIGADKGQVICCDSISVNLFKLLSSALSLNSERNVVLSTEDNFPTDLYMVQGLSELLGPDLCQLKLVSEQNIEQSLNDSVAVLLLTQVNFRTGKLLDMHKITQLAHEKGVLVIWDLAHSAGAIPVELDDCNADFAVGCGYKYLNGGPGSPAFLYVAKRHQAAVKQPLSGWMGHAKPFAFDAKYQRANNINQYLCGTPSVIAMSALDAALDVWQDVDISKIREKSIALADVFIKLVQTHSCLRDLHLCSTENSSQRGSQLAFSHTDAFAICQALIEKGVIADFRAPNILRFGFTPLYTSFEDIYQAVTILAEVVKTQLYTQPRFNLAGKVT
ncbi:kynureninase [Pseudoalteromonas sp. BSi20311]|uniref:kynureninase n=1 Tax=Pseudoalteromonas sp. BSi20311 TaxID=383911 RepID=UPI000231AC68|nr:kynureninase [Pseudoalteromonas sp. BSi20311]GAA65590.1 kynureninase [Pseudoalteromonas sp. BSi20311]HCP98797.1 kynureninase [Pseudoalteromonas sp.]|tara:strand:+ start:447 stop:1682 length:1236 start_codon:yes stop_codon:yes gene_type:complete